MAREVATTIITAKHRRAMAAPCRLNSRQYFFCVKIGNGFLSRCHFSRRKLRAWMISLVELSYPVRGKKRKLKAAVHHFATSTARCVA